VTAAVLPTLAAAAVDGVLVARPRTAVVHLAKPGGAGLTATGRLRRGRRPLCGVRGRTWRASADPTRRLCARCAAHLHRAGLDPREVAPERLTVEQLAALLDTAATGRELHLAVLALCRCQIPGALHDLSPRVAAARARLNPKTRRFP